MPNSLWLNPEPKRIWGADSVRFIRNVFPMYELTLDGLTEAVDVLRGNKPNLPGVRDEGPADHSLANVWNRWS